MYSEKIRKLAKEVDDMDFESLSCAVESMTAYVQEVVNHDLQSERARFRLEGRDLVSKLESLNERRNRKHEKAIESCQIINEIAGRYGKEKIFDFEIQRISDAEGVFLGYSQENHWKISMFCAQYVNETVMASAYDYHDNIIDDVVKKAESDGIQVDGKNFLKEEKTCL